MKNHEGGGYTTVESTTAVDTRGRIILFAIPAQGHLSPMLQIASILHAHGFKIIIIHAEYNSPNHSNYPHFTFKPIADGISDIGKHLPEKPNASFYITYLNENSIDSFKECLVGLLAEPDEAPVACLITDAEYYMAQEVADSLNIPRLVSWACTIVSVLVYHDFSFFYEKGYFNLTMKDSEYEASVPEYPLLKVRDIIKTEADPYGAAKFLTKVMNQISFGTLAKLTEFEFQEVAYGLANTGLPFLWVVRPDVVEGSEWLESFPEKFLEQMGGRGRMVKWCPKKEVLAHEAIGCFWTHCGWNSTLESVCEGVPMICSPCQVGQSIIARYVSDIWKIGIMLEDGLERKRIERVVKRVMLDKEGEKIRERINLMKEEVNKSFDEGGSSHRSLKTLVDYISLFGFSKSF